MLHGIFWGLTFFVTFSMSLIRKVVKQNKTEQNKIKTSQTQTQSKHDNRHQTNNGLTDQHPFIQSFRLTNSE